MGEDILDKVPSLINGLLAGSTTAELIDFLPFLGQLIHRFKVCLIPFALTKAQYPSIPGRIDVTFTEPNIQISEQTCPWN